MTESDDHRPAATHNASSGERAPGSVGRGASAILASRLTRAVTGWIGTIVIVRELSTSEWGAYSFVFGLLGVIGLIVDLQVGRVVLRQVLEAGSGAGRIVGSYVMMRATIGLTAYVITLAIVLTGSYPRDIVLGTAVGGLLFLVMSPAYGIALWFEARLWMAPVATSRVLSGVVQLGLVGAVVVTGHAGIVWFAATQVVGEVVSFAWRARSLVTYRLHLRLNVQWSQWWTWLKEALPLAIGYGLVTLYYKIDIVMLGELDTLAAVGRYSIGYKFADLVSFAPQALLTPVLTLMVASWPHDISGLRRQFRQSFVLVVVAGIGVVTAFALVAQDLIELLYGDRYGDAAGAARFLVGGAALQGVSYLCFVTLIAVGRTRPYALAGLAGVVVNVGLNFLLIPRYSFEGSAWATVATECLVLVVLFGTVVRIHGLATVPGGVIVRTTVAAGAMAGVYLACNQWLPWPGAAAVAGTVFVAALHVLRVDGSGGLHTLLRNARFDTSVVARDEPRA